MGVLYVDDFGLVAESMGQLKEKILRWEECLHSRFNNCLE